MARLASLLVFFAACLLPAPRAASGEPLWQEEFAKMPLTEKVTELDRNNCVRILLSSFQSNSAVQALIFMPGATDEFYFFRRARARLTMTPDTSGRRCRAHQSDLRPRHHQSAVAALAHRRDPLDPIIVVADQRTAGKIKHHRFESMPFTTTRTGISSTDSGL